MQIGRIHQSPLVGRNRELEALRSMLLVIEQGTHTQAASLNKNTGIPMYTQRHPQYMLLMGEAGIGKTRLAEEISREALHRGWSIFWSRAYEQQSGIPYRLWAEVLRKIVNVAQEAKLTPALRFLEEKSLATLLPELDEVEGQIRQRQWSPLQPEQEPLRLWEATRDLLAAISEHTPLLIVLDDLQWADSSSRELLGYLARHSHGFPILFIGTCRDSELPTNPLHPFRVLISHMQREHSIKTLPVDPLTSEQIALLVSHLPESMVQHIQEQVAGNPFFAEELAHTTLPTLPHTVAAALDHRISCLSNPCQQLLENAAVLGGTFELPVITAMEASNGPTDEDTILDLLDEALQSRILTEEETGTRITYHFWHPLMVSHLYEKLSNVRHTSLHYRAAGILQNLYRDREVEGAAKITHHLVQGGGKSQQIVHYAELAGNQAYRISAYPDAERYYRLVLEHLNTSEQQSLTSIDEHLHIAYILELLGECTRVQGKYEEARHFYEQTLEVRSQQNIPTSQQEEAQLRSMLWCELGWTWYDAGDMAQARKYCKIAEQVLQEARIVTGSAWARLYLQQSYINWREGAYKDAQYTALKALKLFDEALTQQNNGLEYTSLFTRVRRTLAGDHVDLGRTHMLLASIAASSGQSKDALIHLNHALPLFEQYDCQREIAIVSCNLGDLYLRTAEYSKAEDILRRSLNLAERIGELPLMSFVFGTLGVLGLRMGNLAKAEAELQQGIMLAEYSDDSVAASVFHTSLATVLQEQGKLVEAGAALHHAFKIGRAMHIIPCISLALVALGSMRITQAISTNINEEGNTNKHDKIIRIWKRAKKTLLHALALEDMEAETKIEGQLMLARVQLSLGEIETAFQIAMRAFEEAQQFELIWLIARAERILGSILVAQSQHTQAHKYFEQALHTFYKHHMRLEYARTLQPYGIFLLETKNREDRDYRRGIEYLREAKQVFTECMAALDGQIVEQALTKYEQTA